MPSHPKPSRSSRIRSRWPFRSWGSRGDSLSRRRARRDAGRLGFQPLEARRVLSAAPVLDTLAAPQLATVVEDAAAPVGPVGTLVSALIDAGGPLDNFSDADGDLPGIAITGTNLQGGTLWYSVDDGASWQGVGTVSVAAPRYLAADAATRLSFQPAANFSGTIADVISFKAWDLTGILEQIGGDIEETTARQFGQSVSISADGGTIAIGSPSSSFNRGRVQVYRWDGTAWTQLGAGFGGLADGDRLGWNVSLSADGNTVALGAPFAAGPGGANAGYVQLYHWTGSTWSPRGTSFHGEAGDNLGFSTAVSADGGTVAIGAPYNDGNGSDAGRVRIYRWNGMSWTQVGSALDGESAGDNFGAAVSIAADGGTVAIGARRHDGTNGSDSGNVRVYRLIDDAWTPLGIGIEGEAAGDFSGFSVSLSADGITIATGAIYNDGVSGLGADDRGHVRVHRWDGSAWHQLGADIDGKAAGDEAGWSISLSGDGETVAIGSPSRDGPNGFNSGQVRVYGWTGSAWRQIGADIDGEATPASLGWSVSLSADASTVAIGAPFAGGSFLGRVRVHRLAPQASSTSTAIDTVSVGVTDVNDPPSDIALSTTSIAENSGPDALVGTLTTTDPDVGDTFAYLLVPGVGDTDNAAFTIVGDQVRATASFDFETKNSYSIRVRSTDQGGLAFEGVFTITVTDVVEMQFVTVGDVGNGNDPATGGLYGAVFYQYRIGTYEVTIGQYMAFLNAVAADDPHGLYNPDMATDLNQAGISRAGEPGSYTYSVIAPAGATPAGADSPADRPITYVSWFDAARFANWMHNGQGSGSTEIGAYTISTGAITAARRISNVNIYTLATPSTLSVGDQASVTGLGGTGFNMTGIVTDVWGSLFTMAFEGADATATGTGTMTGASPTASGGALYRLPTENEWYKAAYYSPTLNSGAGGYHAYATQSDTAPGNTIGDGANQANYRSNVSGTAVYSVTQSGSFQSDQNYLTNVGAFTNSASYYGTFDQSGNVWEWSEVIVSGPFRGLRGGSWNNFTSNVSSSGRGPGFPTNEYDVFGFRLASPLDPNNQAPADIALSATSIAENAGPDALVGTLTTTDPDAGDTFAYLLVPGVGDTDNASFTISGDQVRATASFDFETKNSYSIRVRAFDQGGLFTEQAFTIDVTNVNEPPTDIALSATSIAENAGPNVLVGTLTTTDPDGGEWYAYSYELVPGEGSSGNDAFEIVNDTLRARGSLNHERTPSYEIRVRSTDSGGVSVERSFTITVTDVNERPAIDHILPPADGSYRAGRPLVFTAVLTQPVTRVGRGTIDIGLGVGRATKPAVLVGGLGSNRLRFQYTPVRGDTDTDGVTLGRTVRLARGVELRDAQGRRLALAVPAVATRSVRVDTTAPVVRSLALPAPGTYRPGQELLFTAVLSERVTVTGSGPTIAFSFGSARRLATYESGSGTTRLVFRYVVQPGDVARAGITIAGRLGRTGTNIRDAAGNSIVPTFQAPSGSRIILARARPAPSAATVAGLA